jgi:hypothetical protein
VHDPGVHGPFDFGLGRIAFIVVLPYNRYHILLTDMHLIAGEGDAFPDGPDREGKFLLNP